MKQARYKEPLPLAVIEAARAGDAGAVEQVLQYYNGYINKLCTRTLYDDCGQLHVWAVRLRCFQAGFHCGRSCPADLRAVPGGFPEEAAGIGQDQRCRPHPEGGQENPERLGKQAERTGRPESRNHPRHPGRKCLGQRHW